MRRPPNDPKPAKGWSKETRYASDYHTGFAALRQALDGSAEEFAIAGQRFGSHGAFCHRMKMLSSTNLGISKSPSPPRSIEL
jgi:hypothetical protein